MIEYLLFSKLPVTAVHSPREVLKRVDSNFLEGESLSYVQIIAKHIQSTEMKTKTDTLVICHFEFDFTPGKYCPGNTEVPPRLKEYEIFQP